MNKTTLWQNDTKFGFIIQMICLFINIGFTTSCNKEVADFDDQPKFLFSKSTAPTSFDYYSNFLNDSINSSHTEFIIDRLTNRVDSVLYDHGYFNKFIYFKDSIIVVYPKDTSFIYLANNKIIATTSKGGFQLYRYNERGFLNYIDNTSFYISQLTYKPNDDLDYVVNSDQTIDYYIFHDSLVFNPKLLTEPFNPFKMIYGLGFPSWMNYYGNSTNKLIKARHRYQNGNIIAYTNYDWKIEGDRILSVDINKFYPFNNSKERYIFRYKN
jgi:hypothetical protein